MQVVLSEQEEQRFGELCQMAFNFARNDDCKNLEIMLDAGLNVNLKTHKGDTLAAHPTGEPRCSSTRQHAGDFTERHQHGVVDYE